MNSHGKGFYGEINILIFLKKLNGNYDLNLSPQVLYEFYLYLDSLEQSLHGNHKLIQQIFNKVYSESDLFMSNTVSIGNHMSLNLSSEYGVTLFEALSCSLHHLSKKLQLLNNEDNEQKQKEQEEENNNYSDEDLYASEDNNDHNDNDSVHEAGSVIVNDLESDRQYLMNCALILWDIIKILLKYNIAIHHREANLQRISYYTICILYKSFLILFDSDPFKGDIIDRYIALILNSITFDSMKLCNSPSQNIEYFMPSILTITGDPGIILCDFWFGAAFPQRRKVQNDDDDRNENCEIYIDGCPSPEMLMNLWFRGFNLIDFCYAAEDIVTEYDYCDMLKHRICNVSEIWTLSVLHQYGNNLIVYLWAFKMMHQIIKQRFINLMKVYLNGFDEAILDILSAYHLGLELNAYPNQIWNDEELFYYAMLHIFDLRSDWKSWIATKILPELSEHYLNLIKTVTKYPEVASKWNEKFISTLYNIQNAHFMQFVFIFGGQFEVQSMRLLVGINSYNFNYINYLISFTNFNKRSNFWALWQNSSLFLGLLNNEKVKNEVIEYLLRQMQKKYDGQNSEYILNQICISKFCAIHSFKSNDIIWKRLLWILLKGSKYAKNKPFSSLDVHKYGVPIICKNLDVVKLKWMIEAKLLDAKQMFVDEHVRRLCIVDEGDVNYFNVMRFLIKLFDWIVKECKGEQRIQDGLKEYMKIAHRFRD